MMEEDDRQKNRRNSLPINGIGGKQYKRDFI
jgi:hypothetical protein